MKTSVITCSLISVSLLFVLFVFAQDLQAGLIAYWDFEEGAGEVVHDSTGNNDGTINGEVNWVDGYIGGGLEFDGSTNYVDCGADPSLDVTDTITVTAWIKADIIGDWVGIVTKGIESATFAMQTWGDGSLRFSPNWGDPAGAVGSGSFNSDNKMAAGEWVHAAVTSDGETVRFYINGVLDTLEVELAITFGTNTESLTLGCDFPGGDEYYNGVMDEVRVYDEALTVAEIAQVMAGEGATSVSPSGKLGITWGMIKE